VGAAAARPVGAPASGEGYPFIGSNPTVPLPTSVTDTATVRPLPDTGGHADDGNRRPCAFDRPAPNSWREMGKRELELVVWMDKERDYIPCTLWLS
jgi:hypothetical protein